LGELPVHLQRFETLSGALPVLLYLGRHGACSVGHLGDALDLSERTLRKALRRLITTGYVHMHEARYELTVKGESAAAELASVGSVVSPTFKRTAPEPPAPAPPATAARSINRTVLLAVPEKLIAGVAARVHLHIPQDDKRRLGRPVELALRCSTLNAELHQGPPSTITLSNDALQHTMHLLAGPYSQARLTLRFFQMLDASESTVPCGGLYVDFDVQVSLATNAWVTYTTTIQVRTGSG
jgi:DNA-binding MarR family transcriptional regulator